ncbi:hypothetical protein BDR26DRAFT_849711 [Obelidium mucronatum]|nr:hypothetical protein BDR26DRAFT_849711 [Obelidium mucronatum]
MNKTLKKTQQTQLAKLHARAEGNLEVLSELRVFMKEKAKLDEEYGRSLEKLTKSMAARKFKRGPTLSSNVGKSSTNLFQRGKDGAAASTNSLKHQQRDSKATTGSTHQLPDEPEYITDDGSSVRAIYTTYLAILVESERTGKARASASERIANEISEFLKDYTRERNVSLRKTMDFAIKYHNELHATYDDLEKTKATYERTAKETESAKKKYEDTARSPNSGLNAIKNVVSRLDGDERVELLRQKWKASDLRLPIEAVNSQQTRYYSHDISTWMTKFDHDFHLTARTLIGTYTELESTAFVFDNAQLLTDPKLFSFEWYGADKESGIVVNDASKVVLGHKLSHLKSRMDDLSSALEKKKTEHAGIKQLASTYTATPQFGNAMASLDQLVEVENAIDLIQCMQSRLSAQINLLEKANIIAIKPADVPVSTGGGNIVSGSNLSTRNYTVVYSYSAKESGELSITEGEQLQSNHVESSGWILVQSKDSGQEGLVPFNYIKEHPNDAASPPRALLASTSSPAVSATAPKSTSALHLKLEDKCQAQYDYTAADEGELTFSAGDVISVTRKDTGNESWWEGIGPNGETGLFPANYVKILNGDPSAVSLPPRPTTKVSVVHKAKALYDYQAADSSELSFHVGDEIEILDESDSDWWSGRFHGVEGLFPASYVSKS